MLRRVAFVAACVALALVAPVSALFGSATRGFPLMEVLRGNRNGGADCAACTLIFGLTSQQMQIKKVSAEQSLYLLCSYLPLDVIVDACYLAVNEFAPIVAPLLNGGETADSVCNALMFCGDEAPICRLFPKAKSRSEAEYKAHIIGLRKTRAGLERAQAALKAFNICTLIPGVCRVEDHLPFFDHDGDTFSTYTNLRGSYWRGKDCNDSNPRVFPGRDTSDANADENCNGIFGVDSASGKTYEEEFCAGTGAIGVAALGDSATAHFHIPPTYVTAANLSKATFANLVRNLENELDWPMLSWSTGHLDPNTFIPDISGPNGSLYTHMFEDNRCMHRDYHNVGVNGAKAQNLVDFAKSLNRNATEGVKPLLVLFSMIGNDVCHWYQSFRTMTTPQEYSDQVWAGLVEMDKTVPKGTHVVLIPLVDGRILYDTMHNRIHPIGETNQDVTYTDLYDYLNCLETSPCWGWMNSNATVRNTTWEVASSLNAQLPGIVARAQLANFSNLDVHYLGAVFDDALNKYGAEYPGQRWKLIEPVDGFHPAQLANSLLGWYLYNVTKRAGILPPANPNNAAIKAKFGDQGGY